MSSTTRHAAAPLLACLQFPGTARYRSAFPARRRSKSPAEQLPPIEVSSPTDQNRTRAKTDLR